MWSSLSSVQCSTSRSSSIKMPVSQQPSICLRLVTSIVIKCCICFIINGQVNLFFLKEKPMLFRTYMSICQFSHLYSILQFYSFNDIAESAELPGGFIIGAGAGSSQFVGVNCEVNLL